MRFLLALSFLTSIPVPLGRMSDQKMGQSTRWFPAVGGIVGLSVASIFPLTKGFLPITVAGAIALTLWMAITRGLHLDGLADTFDGLGGGSTGERALEIMKDSRIGTFGALAIGAVLMLKFSCLVSLDHDGVRWIFISPVLARWAVVLAIFSFPPARKNGAGRVFVSYCRWPELGFSSSFALILATVLLGWRGLAAAALAGLFSLAVGLRISRSLKGLTGDSYGCICEMTEVLVLIAGTASLFGRL